jgi:hypothetical protein
MNKRKIVYEVQYSPSHKRAVARSIERDVISRGDPYVGKAATVLDVYEASIRPEAWSRMVNSLKRKFGANGQAVEKAAFDWVKENSEDSEVEEGEGLSGSPEDNILHETANLYLYRTAKGLEIRLVGPTHAVTVGKPKDIDSAKRAMNRMELYPDRLRAMYRHPGFRSGLSGTEHLGPESGFGKEKTRDDYKKRIAWERWAASMARKTGNEATAQGHDMARKAYEKEFAKKFHGTAGLSDYEGKVVSMNYGDMPSKSKFIEHTQGHYPYPMELVGADREVVQDLLNEEGIEEFDSKYRHKLGVRILDAEAMFRFLTQIKDMYESEHEGRDVAGDLASAILGTLGYEWV